MDRRFAAPVRRFGGRAILLILLTLSLGCGSDLLETRHFAFVLSEQSQSGSSCPGSGLRCTPATGTGPDAPVPTTTPLKLLELGRWADASRLYRGIHQEKPRAETASDLAVSLALQGRFSDHPELILEALNLLADPEWKAHPLVRVNRAVLAKEIGLLQVAAKALRDASLELELHFSESGYFANFDRHPQLSGETNNSSRSVSAARDEVLRGILPKLLRAGSPNEEGSLLTRWRALARLWPESDLVAWLDAYERKPAGRKALDSLTRAYQLYWDKEHDKSHASLRKAIDKQTAPQSILAWMCTYLSITGPAEAAPLDEVEQRCQRALEREKGNATSARLRWSTGIDRARQGHYLEAMDHFREAQAHFERDRDSLRVADALYLQSDLLRLLGSVSEGWRTRFQAFRLYARFAPSRFQHALLWDSALAAQEWPHAAIVFHEEDEVIAQLLEDDLSVFEAPFYRAQTHLESDELREASRFHEKAWRELSSESISAVWKRARMFLLLQKAQLAVAQRRSDALDASQEALEVVRASKDQIWLGTALTNLAAACELDGDLHAARANLDAAVVHFERLLEEVGSSRFRAEFLDDAQGAIDRLLDLAIDDRDAQAVAEILQRARALEPATDGLPFEISGRESSHGPTSGPPARLVAYVLTQTNLALLEGTDQGWRIVGSSRDMDSLRNAIRRFHRQLRSNSDPARRDATSRQLYERLITPLRLLQGEALVIVPDRSLANLPFLALQNPDDSRYLGSEHAVIVSPTLERGRNAARTSFKRAGRAEDARVLVVANPSDPSGGLPRLPGVLEEAMALERIYGERATLLVGPKVTRAQVQSALPSVNIAHFAMHTRPRGSNPWTAELVGADEGAGILHGVTSLSHLEFVSLSACDTAVTAETRSRVMSGLARDLLQRGAFRVAAALWGLDDKGAVELQRRLHGELTAEKKPEEAVRLMIRQMLHDGLGPEHWGLLQLVG